MPAFPTGSDRIAIAPIKVLPPGLACEAELYLVDVTLEIMPPREPGLPIPVPKQATSGLIAFHSIGTSLEISLPITMPDVSGEYYVFIDVYVLGNLIVAYQAVENVVVVTSEPPYPFL